MTERIPTLWTAFQNQRVSARRRGISFELTWEEWSGIWQKSGKLEQRGSRKGQYVMARFGDQGPYKIGNVKIIECGENHREGTIGKFVGIPKSEEQKRKQSLTMSGRKLTEDHKRNIGLGVKGRMKGVSRSPEHRKKMAEYSSNRPSSHQETLKAACRTPEHRKQISIRMKQLWEKRRKERAHG